MSAEIINLSCYKFAPLADLEAWRIKLKAVGLEQEVKGTILLAPEGINFFVAGTAPQLAAVLAVIRSIPGLDDVTPKESPSTERPFRRLLVKIKKEIIAFGVEGVDPSRRPAAKISARQLKQWLDEGRPVTLLDTRNDYEIRMGTFKGAVVPHIWNFRDFPAAVEKLPASLKSQPLVMFCTGGIRCEKAGPFMAMRGYTDVLQLDGGILKYFEEVGGAHYEGECFVFDERVGVGPDLRETRSVICFNCQMPLTVEDQELPAYVYGATCHHCIAGKPRGRGNTGEASLPA
ncbi:MAG: rhodanese-like domain-containing protein [Verrucomicrobiota bacterium]|jgi:UPF0176 protein